MAQKTLFWRAEVFVSDRRAPLLHGKVINPKRIVISGIFPCDGKKKPYFINIGIKSQKENHHFQEELDDIFV